MGFVLPSFLFFLLLSLVVSETLVMLFFVFPSLALSFSLLLIVHPSRGWDISFFLSFFPSLSLLLLLLLEFLVLCYHQQHAYTISCSDLKTHHPLNVRDKAFLLLRLSWSPC